MRSTLILGAISLCIVSLLSADASAQRRSSGTSRSAGRSSGPVHVRGYTRRDGTYVPPSVRTAPDGNFNNNWSTKGNFNPYTGEDGTKTNPPVGYGSRSASSSTGYYYPSTPTYSVPSSQYPTPSTSTSRSIANSSFNLDSYLADSDRRMRMNQADELRRLGLDVNWQDHSYLEMSDWSMRIREASNLARVGYDVRWQDHSYLEMSDWEMRIRQASNLARIGYDVRWQDHSYLEMSDWEMRIRRANSLARCGITIDWRKYDLLELLNLSNNRNCD